MQTYTTLMGLYGFTGFVWLFLALMALFNWRAFKQGKDLGWFTAFFLLGLTRFGSLWSTMRLRDNLAFLNDTLVDALNASFALRVQFAAIELIAAILVLFAFRARRRL